MINKVRRTSRRICLILSLRICDFCNSFKNFILENSTVRSFRKFSKCNIIGIDAAINPNRTKGLRKFIFQELLKLSLTIRRVMYLKKEGKNILKKYKK